MNTATVNTTATCPKCNANNRASNLAYATVVTCRNCSHRFVYRPPVKLTKRTCIGYIKRFNGETTRLFLNAEVQP